MRFTFGKKMNIISAIKNAFRSSIFDDLVDNGAEKLERFPDDLLWIDKPNLIWIGNFAIENDALVGAKDDHLVIARRSGGHAVSIKLQDFARESDLIDRNRPFSLSGLRVSFGERGNRYIAERLAIEAE
jgi:hypothetical protein